MKSDLRLIVDHMSSAPRKRQKETRPPHKDGLVREMLQQRSNHRIPGDWNQPVFGAVFLDVADRGEGEVSGFPGGAT
jgi:hypothetical protein